MNVSHSFSYYLRLPSQKDQEERFSLSNQKNHQKLGVMEMPVIQIPAERGIQQNVDYPVLRISWRQEAAGIVFYSLWQQQGIDAVKVEGG